MMTRRLAAFFVTFGITAGVAACKLKNQDSGVLSGPGGQPGEWTCLELKNQYESKRADLVAGLAAFTTSYNALKDAGRLENAQANAATQRDATDGDGAAPVLDPSKSPDELALAGDDLPSSLIGQGDKVLPELPEPLKSFVGKWVTSDGTTDAERLGKQNAECDDRFGRFGQSADTQILEQCRLAINLYNLLITIRQEYNYGRNGECRTGKSSTQTNQTSITFPYCQNPCAFGHTECVKCTYETTLGSNFYICGEAADARQAVDTHCRENGLSCRNIQCNAPEVFNSLPTGTTSARNSNTAVSVEVDFNQKLNVDVNAGVAINVNQETHMKVSIEGNVILKNGRGAPITSDNGGETASTYQCSIGVKAALVRSIGASVGAGFDLVVVKGSATAGVGATFTGLTEYRTTSRDIPLGGATVSSVVTNCARFAKEWGEHDLPDLITKNVAIRAVASRFMGETKDVMQRDTTGEGIYCATDIGATFGSGNKTYRITVLKVGLSNNAISIAADYDGSINGFDRSTDTTIWNNPGGDRYAQIRKKIFESGPDGLSNDDMRYLLNNAWISASTSKFTDCSKTGF